MTAKAHQGVKHLFFAGFPPTQEALIRSHLLSWLQDHPAASLSFISSSDLLSSLSSEPSFLILFLDSPTSSSPVYPGALEDIWSLKIHRRSLPWIAVTALPGLFTPEICRLSGALDHVTYPFDFPTFLQRVQTFASTSLSSPSQTDRLSFFDLLQMACLLRTRLRFSLQLTPGLSAEIGISDGSICHASLSSGISGEDAFLAILASPHSTFSLSPLPISWAATPSFLPTPFLTALPSLLRAAFARFAPPSSLPPPSLPAPLSKARLSTPSAPSPAWTPPLSSSPSRIAPPLPFHATPPPPSLPLLQPALNAFCHATLRDNEDAFACAILHLQEGGLCGVASKSTVFDPAYLSSFSEVAADLFHGPTVQRVEELISHHRGQSARDSFEEIFVATENEFYFLKRVEHHPSLVMLLLTARTTNLGLSWSSLRNRIRDFPDAL